MNHPVGSGASLAGKEVSGCPLSLRNQLRRAVFLLLVINPVVLPGHSHLRWNV